MSLKDAVLTLLPPYLVFGPVAGVALIVVFLLRAKPGGSGQPAS